MSKIILKTESEIASMRRGGKVLAAVLSDLATFAAADMTTFDLELRAQDLIAQAGMLPSFQGHGGFPCALCTSLNNEAVHGIPSMRRVLRDGDLLKIDCGVICDGLHTDSAITVEIGKVGNQAHLLNDATREALYAGIDAARAGNRVGHISAAVQAAVERNGFSVIEELVGHGVGHELHEDPSIPNTGDEREGPLLKPGMTIAIEPIVCQYRTRIETLADDWTIVTMNNSLVAHWEHTLLITEGDPEILTERLEGL